MAFCNTCGARLDTTAQVCAKCGTAAPVTTKVPIAQVPAAGATPQSQSSNALRIVLIGLAVVVALGVVGTVIATKVGLMVAKNVRVEEHDGKVKVRAPGATVETNQDAEEAARNLGVEVYPGAQAHSGNSANVNVGGVHTASAEFESNDPPDKVAEFYKSQLPHAIVSHSGDHYSIVSKDSGNLLTVNIDAQGGKTVIQIANVSGKALSGSEESD